MNADRTITVQHGGKTYSGYVATIKRTNLGYEDHGILTVMLHCEWGGSGIGVGGFCLDKSLQGAGDYKREGTAYGLDHVIRIMETVGVSEWEQIKGKQVIVLFDCPPGDTWGRTAAGIAHVQDDKVLIFQEHASAWLLRKAEVSS